MSSITERRYNRIKKKLYDALEYDMPLLHDEKQGQDEVYRTIKSVLKSPSTWDVKVWVNKTVQPALKQPGMFYYCAKLRVLGTPDEVHLNIVAAQGGGRDIKELRLARVRCIA